MDEQILTNALIYLKGGYDPRVNNNYDIIIITRNYLANLCSMGLAEFSEINEVHDISIDMVNGVNKGCIAICESVGAFYNDRYNQIVLNAFYKEVVVPGNLYGLHEVIDKCQTFTFSPVIHLGIDISSGSKEQSDIFLNTIPEWFIKEPLTSKDLREIITIKIKGEKVYGTK